MKKSSRSIVSVLVLLVAFLVSGAFFADQGRSASLTNVSVTLDNPRPSFRGALTAANSAGSSLVTINTTAGDYPSTSSAQLMIGEEVRIGTGGTMGLYEITSVSPDANFSVDPVLNASHVGTNNPVISTQSAALTVRFTTANAIEDGAFRILVPADDSEPAAQDGIPDAGTWDFGTTPPTVTCPDNLTGYTFAAGTATAANVVLGGQRYHSFVCSYTGAGAIGTAFDGASEDPIIIDSLINPAPAAGHTLGTADAHRIIVQHLDSGNNVQDTTTVSVGVIEAVRVTASVAPQITFRILGIDSATVESDEICGITTGSVSTTPVLVPFGELLIDQFTHAVQNLVVSTNAPEGYTVTAISNDQLGRNGQACPGNDTSSDCIPRPAGDNSSMTHTTGDEWVDSDTKGFGYTLHNFNSTGATPAFEYDSTAGDCVGTYCARRFGESEDTEDPVTIFSASSVADNHNVFVCYKAIIPATQAAGEYENFVTYRATATF